MKERNEGLIFEMTVYPKNSVRILTARERGARGLGSQRLLQQLVEEKTRRMKWQSQVRSILGEAWMAIVEIVQCIKFN